MTTQPDPQRQADLPGFHARDLTDVIAALDAADGGLSDAEASARIARFGSNALPGQRRKGPLQRFLI